MCIDASRHTLVAARGPEGSYLPTPLTAGVPTCTWHSLLGRLHAPAAQPLPRQHGSKGGHVSAKEAHAAGAGGCKRDYGCGIAFNVTTTPRP